MCVLALSFLSDNIFLCRFNFRRFRKRGGGGGGSCIMCSLPGSGFFFLPFQICVKETALQ